MVKKTKHMYSITIVFMLATPSIVFVQIRAQIYFCVGNLITVILMSLLFMFLIPFNWTNWGHSLLKRVSLMSGQG